MKNPNQPEYPEKHDSRLGVDFYNVIRFAGITTNSDMKDGFDPEPRPIPPGLESHVPTGHIAFMGDFDKPNPK